MLSEGSIYSTLLIKFLFLLLLLSRFSEVMTSEIRRCMGMARRKSLRKWKERNWQFRFSHLHELFGITTTSCRKKRHAGYPWKKCVYGVHTYPRKIIPHLERKEKPRLFLLFFMFSGCTLDQRRNCYWSWSSYIPPHIHLTMRIDNDCQLLTDTTDFQKLEMFVNHTLDAN